MIQSAPRPFELVPRRRFVGGAFGHRRSARRGQGDEVAGTRPYRPGDLPAHIDWPASARLSSARGTDEFVVRDFYADDAPCVAVACDRRPAMAIHAHPAPWLDKRAAALATVSLIAASAAAERSDLGYADGADAAPLWLRSGSPQQQLARRLLGDFDAPETGLARALDTLVRRAGSFPSGSFVFVVSDFLAPLPAAIWLRLRALGWDVVPTVVQDPVWELTFPLIGGVVLPIADPATGRVEDVWISARAARERARDNEARHDDLLRRFRRLGFDPVVVDSSDPAQIARRFAAWAQRRRLRRRGRV